MLKHLKLSAAFTAIVTAIAIALTTQALAAGSAVPGTRGGAGSDVISGYVVTDVDYSFGANPSRISAVRFNLDSVADSARVAFGSDAPWNACTVATAAAADGKYAVSCEGLDVPVASADQLSVVAQQS